MSVMLIKKKTDECFHLKYPNILSTFKHAPFDMLLFPERLNRVETRANRSVFTANTNKMKGLYAIEVIYFISNI